MHSIDTNPTRDSRPTLVTDRLKLRPSRLDDVEAISEILADRAIPDTAMYIPHPFDPETAKEWITKHPQKFEDGESVDLYIEDKESGSLLGALHIDLEKDNRHAELGYYIAHLKWGNGYATEAVQAGLAYCFDELKLERVFAWCLCRNEASKKVLQKAGLKPEGILRQHILKWNKLEDIQYFGLLKSEYYASE